MRPQILLLTIFPAVLPLSAIATNGWKLAAGPWVPIKDTHDPQVQFIAQVAVIFYNEKHHRYVILEDVVRGETQDTSRYTKYRLHLVVNQTSSPCYKTVVRDRKKHPHYREVSFFKGEICLV